MKRHTHIGPFPSPIAREKDRTVDSNSDSRLPELHRTVYVILALNMILTGHLSNGALWDILAASEPEHSISPGVLFRPRKAFY